MDPSHIQAPTPSGVPFLLYWGLIVLPTLLPWIAFEMALQTLTQDRYTTYALALAVLYFTGYCLLTDQINWVGNWPMWDSVRSREMTILELDRRALVLSRVLAVTLAVILAVLTLGFSHHPEVDAIRVAHRLRSNSVADRARVCTLGGDAPVAGTWPASWWAGGVKAARPGSRSRITGTGTWPRIATQQFRISGTSRCTSTWSPNNLATTRAGGTTWSIGPRSRSARSS